MVGQRRRRPLAERVFEKIDATGPCWLWTGARFRQGYAAVTIETGRVGRAHRVVWELLIGPIPDGLELDHICRVRHCVNPDHLEPVTRAENVSRGAWRAGVPRRTHCVNGHAFDSDNTITTTRGTRECRTCKTESNRAYRQRRKAAA